MPASHSTHGNAEPYGCGESQPSGAVVIFMDTCEKCGAVVQDEELFCPGCGIELEEVAPPQTDTCEVVGLDFFKTVFFIGAIVGFVVTIARLDGIFLFFIFLTLFLTYSVLFIPPPDKSDQEVKMTSKEEHQKKQQLFDSYITERREKEYIKVI